jgi:hypothetical protein
VLFRSAAKGADRSYAQILQRYAEELHAQAQDAEDAEAW